MSSPKPKPRATISGKVRALRQARRWTQVDLSRRLGLSQSRLSEIERGHGSFTAEQFLAILKIFNVPVTHFAADGNTDAALRNALARLGASHLQEVPDTLPSDRLQDVADVVHEVLVTVDSPRHVTALGPVLVANINRVNLHKLWARLADAGLEGRLGWLLDSTLDAIRQELAHGIPRKWIPSYRRAELLLAHLLPGLRRSWRGHAAETSDILDTSILSAKTLEEVEARSSSISRSWSISTDIQPNDFVEALRASRAGH